MAPRGSIQQAMVLNQTYNESMPYHYSYQPAESFPRIKEQDLVTRETELTNRWLIWKLGRSVASYIIEQCMSDPEAVEAIWGCITESFEGWGLFSALSQEDSELDNLDQAVAGLSIQLSESSGDVELSGV